MAANRMDVSLFERHLQEQFGGRIEAVLPHGITLDRFAAICVAAVADNSDLLACPRGELLMECLAAAEDGLLPDGREGAIVLFKGHPVWMPMVGGLIKLAWQSEKIASLHTGVVYEGEVFKPRGGSDPGITHEIDIDLQGDGSSLDRVRAVYAIAEIVGARHPMIEVINRAGIDKIKAMSRSQRGPWANGAWPVQMALVRPVRRLVKRLPRSPIDERLVRAAMRSDRIDGEGLGATSAVEQLVAPDGGAGSSSTSLDLIEGEIAGTPEQAFEASPVEREDASQVAGNTQAEPPKGSAQDPEAMLHRLREGLFKAKSLGALMRFLDREEVRQAVAVVEADEINRKAWRDDVNERTDALKAGTR